MRVHVVVVSLCDTCHFSCTHTETKSTAVPTQEEAKPKRSRSIEGLASHSQSLESPFEIPAKERAGAAIPVVMATTHSPPSSATEQRGEQTAQKARHFWQKKPTTSTTAAASSSKGAKTGESKEEGKKKDAKKKEKEFSATSSKPPLPTSAKEKKKSGAISTASASQPSSSQQSSKAQEKKSDVASAVKAVKASPPASPELSKKKKHSLFGGKARARSESPERAPKSSKRASSKDSLVGGGSSGSGHPLQAATSVKSLDRESATVSEGGPTSTNVLDIIKRYDQRDELAKSQSEPGHEKVVASTSSSQQPEKPSTKGQKADSAKKEAAGKGKGQKEKPSKEDKKKEGSSSKGLLSFFKRGKAHEEETGSSKQQKKKAKKDKEKESKQTGKEYKAAAEKEPEHHHQLTIKGRIERLKESGVYTDGDEGTDANVVLVAVTKLTEEEGEVERTDNLSRSQDETERSSGDEGEEGHKDTDLIAERREVETKPEEETAQVAGGGGESDEVSDAVDRVKRLQSIFQSVSSYVPSIIILVWYGQCRPLPNRTNVLGKGSTIHVDPLPNRRMCWYVVVICSTHIPHIYTQVPERSPGLGRSLSTSAKGAKR